MINTLSEYSISIQALDKGFIVRQNGEEHAVENISTIEEMLKEIVVDGLRLKDADIKNTTINISFNSNPPKISNANP